MKVICKFELGIVVTDKALEYLMDNEETKKITLGVFEEKMLEDLSNAIAQMPHTTIKINEIKVEETK